MKEDKNPWNKTNQWVEELEILKNIINKTQLEEATKWGGTVYTHNSKNVLGIGGFKSYFGLWFFNGAFLKDEQKVLVAATQDTKALRQWRMNSKTEINEKLILQYIAESIENEKQGKILKPSKGENITSTFFENQLQNDVALQEAFQKFSPYKQKEFLEYIETAKQEKTKITRFEKIKPMILENIGLNDKYRK
jgi:uncharacterized protein YdeI (YjbR/CyaY-like superfamily)